MRCICSVSFVSFIASVANADSLLALSNTLAVNNRVVLVGTDAFYWDTGGAMQVNNNLWTGWGWETFPGGAGGLTALQVEPMRKHAPRPLVPERKPRRRCASILTWNYD
mgnify:CR=1 FL=1